MLSTPTCKRVFLRYRRVNMEALPVAMATDRQYSLSLYRLCALFYSIMDMWCEIGKSIRIYYSLQPDSRPEQVSTDVKIE
jgi:hypothetical protein